MKYLPIGLDVRGRKCVVVGGGRIGTRKVENLLRAGAAVHLVSPEVSPRLAELAGAGSITWTREPFETDHLDGALLAVAATNDEGLNARLVEVGKELGVMTCDASSSERSELIFGALHQGSGATIAVFTDGEDPARSRATRDRIAALLPESEELEEPSEAGNPMLILIAHGSRDPNWRASLEKLTDAVQERSPGGEVRLAFMQFTGPTLPEVVEEGWARGLRRFRLLPLFMAAAGHVDKDIRPMVEELARRFPEGRIELLSPIGESYLFSELVTRIAKDDRS